jgi:hypothetical protein
MIYFVIVLKDLLLALHNASRNEYIWFRSLDYYFQSVVPKPLRLPLISQLTASWGVESKLDPLGTSAIYWPIVPAPGDCEDGEFGGMNGKGNRSTRRKLAPAPLCPPQIPLDQTRDWTRAAVVGSQWLTASAMARPTYLPNRCVVEAVAWTGLKMWIKHRSSLQGNSTPAGHSGCAV